MTAYTLASDSELWKTNNFDLFTVIARREFWGRTLEFFVNAKKQNPDRFFRTYLEYLKPETIYAKQLNHFVQYYLIAQEKDAGLEPELIQKCIEILLHSPNPEEVQIAQMCLFKLPLKLDAEHLTFVQKIHNSWKGNFCAVKLAQLYYAKGQGFELLPALRETSQLKVLVIDNGLFYRFRNYCLLGLLQRDYQIWKHLLIQGITISDFGQLNIGLALRALRDLRDLRDLRNLLDLLDLWDWLDLRDLRDLGDLRDLRDLQDSQDLRALRDRLDLRNWLQLEQRLELECRWFIQSLKFPPYLSKLQGVKDRFQALTPEQKRKYFINVDE